MKKLFIILIAFGCQLFSDLQAQTKELKLEDIFSNYIFSPRYIRGIRSMNDGEFYTSQSGGNIISYRYKTGMVADTVFSSNWFKDMDLGYLSDYVFSDDETKIILTTNVQSIYRHSFVATYFVYNRNTRELEEISKNGNQQLADFSPDGTKVAFVRNNNIYISDLITGIEFAVTTDGKFNEIINGAPDWVYEEEFGFSKAFEWSPDGNNIAFMRFDESHVRSFSMVVYDSLYPTVQTFKYPKAGEDNSIVTIWNYDLTGKRLQKLDVGKETDQYIPRIKWTNNAGKLCIHRLNRLQNKIDILISDVTTGMSNVVFTETNKYFISEVNDQYITFTSDGKYFIIFSERTGFNHLYMYSIDGKLINPITMGNFDVASLLSVDEKNKVVYYTSAEMSPLDRNIYSIHFNGAQKKRISKADGTSTAEFSKNHQYYILTHSTANTPVSYTLCSTKGEVLRVIEDNNRLKGRFKEYGFQPKEFITVPTANDIKLNGFIIKPVNMDSSKKYPVFMFVYGGPQSQDVTNSWDRSIAWYQYLVQKGYVVACIDNRGTDGRGEGFKKCTYMQLGKLELEDQVNAAKYLGTLSYIDPKRIGIFGWSYGGYMTSLCMTKGEGVFKMGIAVAPVTNWRYYDNIYTERFMRKPQDNSKGYDDNSPINFADKLTGNFLLIHGSADDNVHVQNSIVFSEKLVQAGKKFDQFIYTDKNHGIYGGNTRMHLYTMMTEYILKNL